MRPKGRNFSLPHRKAVPYPDTINAIAHNEFRLHLLPVAEETRYRYAEGELRLSTAHGYWARLNGGEDD